MKIETLLYIINVIVNIDVFLAITFITFVSYIICSICFSYSKTDHFDETEKLIFNDKIKINIKLLFMAFIILFINCFIPSEKTMYLMLSTKYIKNTDIPSKVLTIINNKLDKYIEDKE